MLPPDDFDAQARMVMENLAKALAAGGATFSDVTKVTIYIVNQHDVAKARGILANYFGATPPASTLCVLRGLANPNFLVEVEAIAAVEQVHVLRPERIRRPLTTRSLEPPPWRYRPRSISRKSGGCCS